ncbi:MAG TPA: pyridoxal-dependent decarboxylase [Polyangiaceae bacterium]|nr:pyridoxal-dependent decarboxylase [Polyangiaceae bacterium]
MSERGEPLEPTPERFRALAERLLAFTEQERARTLEEPMRRPRHAAPTPELDATHPAGLDAALAELREAVLDSWNTTSPRYMGFIPGGGLPTAALADFVALAMNRYVGIRTMAPALAGLETSVVRWLSDLVGYSESALGVLTSGGSASILTAVVAAREARLSTRHDASHATLYVSEQTHGSVRKAARTAGFPSDAVRSVPVDACYRMNPRALDAIMRDDAARGRRPFLVVASAGTTNTGAIDPLVDVCSVGARHGAWVHADAAYGGFFLLTERGKRLLAGVERCDSVTLDPHKGMFLPYGTGALVVRRGTDLSRAFALSAGYLRDVRLEESEPSFVDLSFEMSREFRGLRLWLPLKLHGADRFRDALDEKLDLAAHAYRELSRDDRLELLDEPQLTTLVFRPRHGDANALLEAVNASGRAFLSSTVLDGKVTVRMCILGFRTERRHVDDAIAAIRASL